MKIVDLKKYVKFINAAELVHGEQGIIPFRFPTSTIDTFEAMIPIARMQTSIELQLKGNDLKDVELTVKLLDTDGYGFYGEWFIGGNKILPNTILNIEKEESKTVKIAVPAKYGSLAPLRFVFPTHCTLEIIGISVNDEAQLVSDFEPFDYSIKSERKITWVVHGDSITQGANTTCPTTTWVDLTARKLGLKAVNLGIGGHGKAEECMAHYLATRTDADVLSLHIGANLMWSKGKERYEGKVLEFLKIIRQGLPETPIILVSPIGYFKEKFPHQPAQELRQEMQNAVETLQKQGDKNLYYFNGLQFLDTDEGYQGDGLHLSEYGMMRYAENLIPAIKPIFGL